LPTTRGPLPPSLPAEASGSNGTDAQQVRQLSSLICSDPEAAAARMQAAVLQGGTAAQAALAALFQNLTPAPARKLT